MQLPADQVRRINRGERTTVRVPVDRRLTEYPLRDAKRGDSKPFRPRAEDRLPLRSPDGRESLLVDITNVLRGPLGTLTPLEAMDEGYPTPEDFVQAWVERHDGSWLERQVQALIDVGVPEDEAEDTRWEWAQARYRDRWQDHQVWTLTVAPARDVDRFLAPAAQPKGSELGYVLGSTDVIDAGRAQPVSELSKHWKQFADRRHLKARELEDARRRARSASRRLREAVLRNPDDPALAEIEQSLRKLEGSEDAA